MVYFRIFNPIISVTNVENSRYSTQLLAATTLRNILYVTPPLDRTDDRFVFLFCRQRYKNITRDSLRSRKHLTFDASPSRRGYRSVGCQSGTCRNVRIHFLAVHDSNTHDSLFSSVRMFDYPSVCNAVWLLKQKVSADRIRSRGLVHLFLSSGSRSTSENYRCRR